MNAVTADLAVILFVLDLVVAAASWVAGLIYGINAVRHRQPGAHLPGGAPLWNPANALLYPKLLTAEGLVYRRKCFLSTALFLLSVGIPLLVGALIGIVK